MVNALREARRLGMDCVQVFTKNQRQWRAPPLDPAQRDDWLAMLRELGWLPRRGRNAPHRTVSHNTYLINLASPDRELWERSLALQRVEIERCEQLRIPLCVMHPGAYAPGSSAPRLPRALGAPPSKQELAGMERLATALDRIHADLSGYETITCLETTTGAGSALGYDFTHLAMLRGMVRQPERVGYCLDTCHVLAAGYDVSERKAAQAVLQLWDAVCGLRHLLVVHLNDSKGPLGSRLDRHTHIGHGFCRLDCFRTIVNHPALRDVPKILETPKEEDERGRPWDLINLRRLKRLIRPSRRADKTSWSPTDRAKGPTR
jgi:deoxyribonuclease-4